MATSSIIENIRVNNPKILEEYAKYLEETENEPVKPKVKEQRSNTVIDSERIRRFAEQALAKKGMKL